MKPIFRKSGRPLLLGLLLFSALAFAQTPNEPIVNFKLPLFNDKGYRTGYLRGEQGIYVNTSEIRILGMELNQYTGDERDAVIGKLESPEALFEIDSARQNAASGPGRIRVENASFNLTGEDWNWRERNNQVVINRNVKIVLFDSIGNVIK